MRSPAVGTVVFALLLFGCGRLGFDPALPAVDAGTDAEAPPADAETVPPCENLLRDGDEEGVDCGGACPVPCSTAYACAQQTQILPGECWALVDLYQSTTGGAWLDNTGWLTDRPCLWNGVRCLDGHVTEINLPGNRLDGHVPSSIAALRFLLSLNLGTSEEYETCPYSRDDADKNILGALPPELGSLARLQLLQMNCAGLTGTLPPELASLRDLRTLRLHANALTGSVPPGIGGLASLRVLELDRNALTGSIPESLSNLVLLEELWLADNQLDSNVPPGLGTLTNLVVFGLNDNRLSGTIPPELGNLTNVQAFRLSGNAFTGGIPSELGSLTMARSFTLNDNGLEGEVPPELMAVPGTTNFLLNGNGCLTATGAEFIAWLTAKDPLWDDGC